MYKSKEAKRKKTTKWETLWINDVRFYLNEWRMPKPFFLIIFCYNKNTLTLIGIISISQKFGWIFPFYRMWLVLFLVWKSINGISFCVHRNRYRMFFLERFILYTIGTSFPFILLLSIVEQYKIYRAYSREKPFLTSKFRFILFHFLLFGLVLLLLIYRCTVCNCLDVCKFFSTEASSTSISTWRMKHWKANNIKKHAKPPFQHIRPSLTVAIPILALSFILGVIRFCYPSFSLTLSLSFCSHFRWFHSMFCHFTFHLFFLLILYATKFVDEMLRTTKTNFQSEYLLVWLNQN